MINTSAGFLKVQRGSVDLWATAYLLNGRTSVISSNSVTTTRAIKIYRSQIKLQFNWTSMKEHWTCPKKKNIEPGSTIFHFVKRCDLRTWLLEVRYWGLNLYDLVGKIWLRANWLCKVAFFLHVFYWCAKRGSHANGLSNMCTTDYSSFASVLSQDSQCHVMIHVKWAMGEFDIIKNIIKKWKWQINVCFFKKKRGKFSIYS